jgi:hypothetical protein
MNIIFNILKIREIETMNKSAVCRIANRISRVVSRHDAFIRAWRIVKAGAVELKVAGVTFGTRQEALRRLGAYKPQDIHAVLVPENSRYDPNAIAVKVTVNGARGIYRLGYIAREQAGVARVFLGRVPELSILGGEIKGVRLRLAV